MFDWSVWVHNPDYNEAGKFECAAETQHYRQAVAVAQAEQREFPSRVVRVFKLVGPGKYDTVPWPGEKQR